MNENPYQSATDTDQKTGDCQGCDRCKQLATILWIIAAILVFNFCDRVFLYWSTYR
jgi:hypothetical protein